MIGSKSVQIGPSLALMYDNPDPTIQTVSDVVGTDWRVSACERPVR
jgi:hypothetical protein